jgi:hypothetical protein
MFPSWSLFTPAHLLFHSRVEERRERQICSFQPEFPCPGQEKNFFKSQEKIVPRNVGK